jgi:hypothetical protein
MDVKIPAHVKESAHRHVAMLDLTASMECSLVYVGRPPARAAACASQTRPVYFFMYMTTVDGIIPARFAAAASS